MRYCKDCEHYEIGEKGPPICARFKKTFIISEHPVYGPRIGFSAPDCAIARDENGQCGPQARFFAARYASPAWYEERESKLSELRAKLEPSPSKSLWARLREIFA